MSGFALSDKQRILAIFFTLVKDGHCYTEFQKDSPIDFVVMTLTIEAAKGDIKKNYCLLLFMFDDVFLKRDGSLENTHFI